MFITDTNSLMYEHYIENVNDGELFDFINYFKESKYNDDKNNLRVDKIKRKTCDVPVKTFLVLKPKIYSYITEDGH